MQHHRLGLSSPPTKMHVAEGRGHVPFLHHRRSIPCPGLASVIHHRLAWCHLGLPQPLKAGGPEAGPADVWWDGVGDVMREGGREGGQ